MYTREVVAKLLSDNPLKIGFDTTGQPVLGLDGFSHVIAGTTKRFIYKDERGMPTSFLIDGQHRFNLDNPIDVWNLNTLKADIKLHPELAEQVKIIDPEAEADAEVAAAKQLTELLNILLKYETDAEWVSKVYRRVLSRSASGLTTKVMFRALFEKAKESTAAFRQRGEWVFEGEYFETEALLDLATERGVVIKDGEMFKKSDGIPFADTRAKAIYELKTNAAFRHFVQSAVSAPVTDIQPDSMWQLEIDADDELLELTDMVGTQVKTATPNEDGSVDDSSKLNDRQVDLEKLVEELVDSNVATLDEGTGELEIADLGKRFANRSELIGWIKGNPEQEVTLREYAKLV